jgi:hypothetical protein
VADIQNTNFSEETPATVKALALFKQVRTPAPLKAGPEEEIARNLPVILAYMALRYTSDVLVGYYITGKCSREIDAATFRRRVLEIAKLTYPGFSPRRLSIRHLPDAVKKDVGAAAVIAAVQEAQQAHAKPDEDGDDDNKSDKAALRKSLTAGLANTATAQTPNENWEG